jgi:hypothetical protein
LSGEGASCAHEHCPNPANIAPTIPTPNRTDLAVIL